MTPEEIIQYICNRLSGVVPKASWGETSLFYNPGYTLPNGVYFCTIKQHNGENDKASNLDREDVFRVAIGLTPKTYVRLFGRRPIRPGKGGIVATEHDFTELNELMPHPIYAWMSWVQILSPSRDKFEEVFPLIEEAHQEAVKKFEKKTAKNRVQQNNELGRLSARGDLCPLNTVVRVSHSTTMEYLIRQAEVADAPGACETVRQSIAELCIEDHHGDQATIAAWLSNKTIENVASWIASPRNITAVAQASIGIVGFGLLSQSGTLALLYVSPLARFHGVSKGLIAFLESEASRLGIREIRLESSATARQFYEGRGFSPVGESSLAFGTVISYPMWKGLVP